ncbi:hypothetical protein CMQ_401 [Grosmannia clavigera kw1407]|uniref:Uncharacterized protein n=1 Tax=Grosmannia clavigera (strain kw1407 / UAMH 11150) TaxID=655863 RepID=F0XDD4_GROCL|nr:uncharacterized protein CMQ_401 [Grosmannia clavigera kw1407]EFX03473.1 hypothetical protein CMQ_401 [Grosmannia clavigera kw1407]
MSQGSFVNIYACRCREEQRSVQPRGCLSVFSTWMPAPNSPPQLPRQYIPELCPKCLRVYDLRQQYGLMDSSSARRQRERRHVEDTAVPSDAIGVAISAPEATPAVPTVRPPKTAVCAPVPSARGTTGTGPRGPAHYSQRRQSEPVPGRSRTEHRRYASIPSVSRPPPARPPPAEPLWGPGPSAPSRPPPARTPNKLQKRSSTSPPSTSRPAGDNSHPTKPSRAKEAAAKSGLRVDTAHRRSRLSTRVLSVLTPRAMESDESLVCRDARRIESGR